MIPYGKRHLVVLRWISIKNLTQLYLFLTSSALDAMTSSPTESWPNRMNLLSILSTIAARRHYIFGHIHRLSEACRECQVRRHSTSSRVQLNFGLSPDFSVQLKVSLSESPTERLGQKLKWPTVQLWHIIMVRCLMYSHVWSVVMLCQVAGKKGEAHWCQTWLSPSFSSNEALQNYLLYMHAIWSLYCQSLLDSSSNAQNIWRKTTGWAS